MTTINNNKRCEALCRTSGTRCKQQGKPKQKGGEIIYGFCHYHRKQRVEADGDMGSVEGERKEERETLPEAPPVKKKWIMKKKKKLILKVSE